MVSRLVLGSGTVAHTVLEAIRERPGDLLVLDPDESRIESLRNEKVAAETADVTDPGALLAHGDGPDVVFVASDDAAINARAAEAAATALPDAYLVAYTGTGATADHRARLAAAADRVCSAGAAVVDHVEAGVERGTDARARHLRETLESVEGTLTVLAHDNPDPDAIAAAIALCRIAEALGVDAEPCYFGDISHQENRAFVNLLELELTRLDPEAEYDFDAVALVDHSAPGVNDQLDPETPVDVVIDHHPAKGEVSVPFADIREDVGATSTIMTQYLDWFGVEYAEALATALLYGIRIDTKDFKREITQQDFGAAADLLPHAAIDVLERIESPSISADTFEVVARGIRNREVEGDVLASCVGAISDRDAIAQAADRLLAIQGVTVTFVYGFMDGTIYASARGRGNDVDLGEALRVAFDGVGSAGGHTDMAGAQLPLGVFAAVQEDEGETLASVLEGAITPRFFEAVRGEANTDEIAPVGDATAE
ncbi:nanoRNase/pAp phosphatase (c-di-AMP/oligoRNAs hydrolase) [Halarchaeum rubridurum]|uniref:DHH family phosphoesterase n=1 Tax=Halarchaeum rubridurum TaxID=489911 RepID=A0A830G3U3_9EURY|nr:DHH family phosphoesterase [Halarchaeum rubridurum]MBP1955516.1 nanoRNase/pAp phosphatase (c-di-AMP/oligoRNAs hydrolase) [Halarchaeum rubridurum]GGM72957.1 DHH family phosphoesterase [Halarchaeum rubridurum]